MLNMTLNSDLNEQVLFMVTTAKNIISPTDIINGVGMQYLCEMLHNMFSIARSLTESYYNTLAVQVAIMSGNQRLYYVIELACIIFIILTILILFPYFTIVERRDDLELMSIIERKSYAKEEEEMLSTMISP